MSDLTYTKGIYTATASVKELTPDEYQGVVSLTRDDGDTTAEPDVKVYEVKAATSTPAEALEEAKALAHRILGEIEL